MGSILQQERLLIGRLVDNLSVESLLVIPPGFRNNILWNLGHVVVTQQRLHNRLAGLEMYVSPEIEQAFRTGTSPADWSETPDLAEIRQLLDDLPARLREDYEAGRFSDFREYTTATGIRLQTIEDAIAFNHFHEGVHLGIMKALRVLVS